MSSDFVLPGILSSISPCLRQSLLAADSRKLFSSQQRAHVTSLSKREKPELV